MSLVVTGLVSTVPDVYTSRAGEISVTLEIEIEANDRGDSVSVLIDDDSLVDLVLREAGIGAQVVITGRRLAVDTRANIHRAVVIACGVEIVRPLLAARTAK